MSMSPSTAWAKLNAALTQMAAIDAAIDAAMKASDEAMFLNGDRLADWAKQTDVALTAFEVLNDAPDATSDIADLLSRSYGEPDL